MQTIFVIEDRFFTQKFEEIPFSTSSRKSARLLETKVEKLVRVSSKGKVFSDVKKKKDMGKTCKFM